MAIVDICMVDMFRFLFAAYPRIFTLTAPQTGGMFLSCVQDLRAFRTVQAALQTATPVVDSHGLVS